VNDGMDILGGKGIMRGPGNLLGVAYRHAPIAITVEGANLLTRALIIFGRGAVRCHPQVLAEMQAVEHKDPEALGRALLAHGAHVLRNLGRSLFGARVHGTVPDGLRDEAAAIARLSARYALSADLAMGLLGGKLKRLELLSARLGDALSALYLAAACVWRYEAEAEAKMLPFARAAIRTQLARADALLRALHANLPAAVFAAGHAVAARQRSACSVRPGSAGAGRYAAQRPGDHFALVPGHRPAEVRRAARPDARARTGAAAGR
jgi:acyl-CoA dehydrogenase